MSCKVIVIEDDVEILNVIKRTLNKENYQAIAYTSGRNVIESIIEIQPQLILLDINLPDINGLELLKNINGNPLINSIPAILMTGKYKKEEDVVKGLRNGAADYIVKPFTPDLLMARIETVLRRNYSRSNPSRYIKAGRISINLTCYAAYKDNELISLSKAEFKLLHFLIRKPGIVLESLEIIEYVWRDYEGREDRMKTLNKLVNRLRNKLGDDGAVLIKTEYGVGYKLCIESEVKV